MKKSALLCLVLLLAACNRPSEADRVKTELDSLHKDYRAARRELHQKRDTAKIGDKSKDVAFLYRLNDAETRARTLKQEILEKRQKLRALRKDKDLSDFPDDSLTQ